MRRRTAWTALAALLVCGAGATGAAAKGAAAKGAVASPAARVAVDAPVEKLKVFTDGKGHYVAVVPTSGTSFVNEFMPGQLYYSGADRKVWLQQRTRNEGGSVKEGDGRYIWFWEPRSDLFSADPVAVFSYKPGRAVVECAESRTAVLTEVTGDARTELLDGAVFHAPIWDRLPYALVRDDAGNYVYVDRDAEKLGFRLWRGKRGAMKPLIMTNVVSDSRGDIFMTKLGQLRLIIGKGAREAEHPAPQWIQGKKSEALTWVPVVENQRLIHALLGVYEGELFGTPCDDL